ncbi:MAG: circadian clock KaiB family protein [Bryobacteraceae bacterium]
MRERRLIRLYISGATPRSVRAVQNLKAICDELGEGCELEIIDVYQQAEQAEQDGVLVTPTLVERSRGVVRRLVAELADRRRLRQALGLARG